MSGPGALTIERAPRPIYDYGLNVFNPRANRFGAKGDGGVSDFCNVTASSVTMTAPKGTFNKARDEGKPVTIYGGAVKVVAANGPEDGDLTTFDTVMDVVSLDGSTVTLHAAPTRTQANAHVVWGTDDTTTLQACADAAHTAYLSGAGAAYIVLFGNFVFTRLYQRAGVHFVSPGKGVGQLLCKSSLTYYSIIPDEVPGRHADNVGMHGVTVVIAAGYIPFHSGAFFAGDNIVLEDSDFIGGNVPLSVRSCKQPIIRGTRCAGSKAALYWNGTDYVYPAFRGFEFFGDDTGLDSGQVDVLIEDCEGDGLCLDGGHPGTGGALDTDQLIRKGRITATIRNVATFVPKFLTLPIAPGTSKWYDMSSGGARAVTLSGTLAMRLDLTIDGVWTPNTQANIDLAAAQAQGGIGIRAVFLTGLDQGQIADTDNTIELKILNNYSPKPFGLVGASRNRFRISMVDLPEVATLISMSDGINPVLYVASGSDLGITTSAGITADTAEQTVQLSGTDGSWGQSVNLVVDTGANREVVPIRVIDQTAHTVMAVFTKNHASGVTVRTGTADSAVKITAAITVTGAQAVAVNSTHFLAVGDDITLDVAGQKETVILTAVDPDALTISANFLKTHVINTTIGKPYACHDNTFEFLELITTKTVVSFPIAILLTSNVPPVTGGRSYGVRRNRWVRPRFGAAPSALFSAVNNTGTTAADTPLTGVDANHIDSTTALAELGDGFGQAFGTARDVNLRWLATGRLGLVGVLGAANPQVLDIYQQRNDASNYARLKIGHDGTRFVLLTEQAGTPTAQNLVLGTGGTTSLFFWTNSASRWLINGSSGHFLAGTDNTYDIGQTGATRPRHLYLAGNLVHQGTNLGFFNTAVAAKQTVTGSRGGSAAVTTLLSGLAAYGLITDSSTATGGDVVAVGSGSADHTLALTESVWLSDASGGNRIITLPTAVGNTGQTYTVVKTDASANTVTLDGAGSETINGALTVALTAQYDKISVISNGTNWLRLG